MQVYDLQISSDSDVGRINAQGDYIYYSSGSAGGSSPCVEVRGINTGFRVKLFPGQGMRLPMGQVERDWLIKPDTGIAGSLIGSVVIGEGEIFDNRITGSVEVIDGGENETKSGVAYAGCASCYPVLSQYSNTQIWVPESYRKLVVVKRINFSVSIMTGVIVKLVKTELTGSLGYAVSKLSGGEKSGVLLKRQNSPGFLGGGAPIFELRVAAASPYLLDFREPVVLKPGWGLLVYPDLSGVVLNSNFEFTEEPV